MNKIVSGVLAVTLVMSSGAVLARDRDDWQGGRSNNGNHNGNNGNHNGRDRGGPGYHGPDEHGRETRVYRYRVDEYRQPRGYEVRTWHRGERLPPPYRAQPYYVTDYGHYGLYRPPVGHRWVRVDGDAVLVAVTTGVVAGVVAGLFYH
ncbi:hypothetical protein BH10PSE17_BH10PSE17_26070 [soil metagenome]